MTKLVKAVNPEELQAKLDKLADSDQEDRPWWVHGKVFKDDGYYYQFLTDQNPNPRITLVFDSTNIAKIVKELGKLEKD